MLCVMLQALQCFQEAAPEVEKEEFLIRLTGSEEEAGTTAPRLLYYNKVQQHTRSVLRPVYVVLSYADEFCFLC